MSHHRRLLLSYNNKDHLTVKQSGVTVKQQLRNLNLAQSPLYEHLNLLSDDDFDIIVCLLCVDSSYLANNPNIRS
jgi:hypothetical protein